MATLKTPEEIAAQYGYSLDKESSIETAKKYYQPQEAALEGEKTTAYQTATQESAQVQNQFMTDITTGYQTAGQAGMGTSGAALAAQTGLGTEFSSAIGAIATTLSNTIAGLDAKINQVYADAAKAASSLYGKKLSVTNQFAQADFDNQVQQEQLDLQKAEMEQAYELAMKQIASNEAIAQAQIDASWAQTNASISASAAGNAAMMGAMQDFATIIQNALEDATDYSGPVQGPPVPPPSSGTAPKSPDSDGDGIPDNQEKF